VSAGFESRTVDTRSLADWPARIGPDLTRAFLMAVGSVADLAEAKFPGGGATSVDGGVSPMLIHEQ